MQSSQRDGRRRFSLGAMALVGVGLLVLGVAAALWLPKTTRLPTPAADYSVTPIKVEFDPPELALTDLAGNPVSLADWPGQVVLVNNWATWCPPCKAEMPALEAYYQDHHEQGFTIVAIESGSPLADVSRFVEEYDLSFPVWPDLKSLSLAAINNDSLPNSYVIDRGGVGRLAWTGPINQFMLEKYVTPLLEE